MMQSGSQDESLFEMPEQVPVDLQKTGRIGPWVRKSVAVPYKNAWIQVEHHEVVDPSGANGIYGVVRYRHRALGCIPLHDDGTITLVGQHRYPLDRYFWEIPEGGGRPGHDPLEEMQRELQEETGLTARTWIPLGEIHLSNSCSDESALLWLARDLTEGVARPDSNEQIEVKRIPFQEALEQALDGRLTDSLSVVALLRAARLV